MNLNIVIFVVLGYFLILLLISYFTGKKADNYSFFIGNRRSPWYIVAFGMISASLSGVTFISVPGWVIDSQFSYMQMVLGYLLGYFIIANVLIPLYYRLNLTSIYTYLEERFGYYSYKTGASLFLVSRIIGASFRLFIVANVLQIMFFNALNIPFELTVIFTILLIWLYTFRGGIKTIIWTDSLQTITMLVAAGLTVFYISKDMEYTFGDTIRVISDSKLSKMFFIHNWKEGNHFVKMFFSGALISVVMTGLDQDMMQKNLSCRNIKEARKNMYWFSIALVPVNFLFLSLGVLLVLFAKNKGIPVPQMGDDLFPLIATSGHLPYVVAVMFLTGLIAAAYSSADSALTALTTSFTVDILNSKNYSEKKLTITRKFVHVFISLLLLIVIIVFNKINDKSVIDRLFYVAGFTYGPLLGLFGFGLLTKKAVKDKWVPVIAVISPALCFFISWLLKDKWNYQFGYEILLLNGILTFIMLYIMKIEK